MAKADFSLKEKDRKRLVKDRLVRFAVSAGGVGVLAALVLIFVYLAMMVLPLFSDAKLTPDIARQTISTPQPLAAGIDDYGQHAFVISQQGQVDFWSLEKGNQTPQLSVDFAQPFKLFAEMPGAQRWYAFASQQGLVTIFQPELKNVIENDRRTFAPQLNQLDSEIDLKFENVELDSFAFSVGEQKVLVGYFNDQRIRIRWQSSDQQRHSFALNKRSQSLIK